MNYVDRTKQTLKSTVAAVLYYTGIVKLLRKRKLRQRATILMYHRIVDSDNMPGDYIRPDIIVKRSSFKRQLEYLRKNYRLTSLGQLKVWLDSGQPIPDGTCVITFDDGWKDTFDHAFPLSAELNVPITVFVTTNFVEKGQWFWEQRFKFLISALWHAGGARSDIGRLEHLDQLGIAVLQASSEEVLIDLTSACLLKLQDRKEWIPQVMAELERAAGNLELPRPFTSWDEVVKMSKANVEIGAHTISHPDLTRCDSSTVLSEVTDSVSRIENVLGSKIDLFAYPYGKHDDRVVNLVKKTPVAVACTTASGFVTGNENHLALPRIGIHEGVAPTTAMFACRILKLFNRY